MKKVIIFLSLLLAISSQASSQQVKLGKSYTKEKAVEFLEERGFVSAWGVGDYKKEDPKDTFEKGYAAYFSVKELTEPSPSDKSRTLGFEKIIKVRLPNFFSSAYIAIPAEEKYPPYFVFAVDAGSILWSEEGFNFRIYEKGNPKAIYQADSKKGSMQKDLAFIMASDKKVVKNFLKSISSPKTLIFHYNEDGEEYSYELPEEDKEYIRRTAQTYLELIEHFKK